MTVAPAPEPAPPTARDPLSPDSGLAREARLRQRAEQLRQVLEGLPLGVAVAFALAVVAVAVFWRHAPHGVALAWLAAIGAVGWLRLGLYSRYRRLPPGDYVELLRLSRPLWGYTAAAGAAWGSSVLALYDPGDLVHQLLLLFMLAGLTAGSASAMGADRRIALAFQLPVTLPVVVRLALAGDAFHLAMSAMVLLYAGYVAASVSRMSAQTSRNIELRMSALQREQALSQSEMRYRQLAHQDALTALPNRFALQSHLALLLGEARRSGTRVALLYIDLDDFKGINDTRGHAAGDRMLIEVAARLCECAGGGDMVARMGGDEFIVVTRQAPDRDGVARLAERMREAVARPLDLGGEQLSTRASIGIGIYPEDGADAAQLMKHADTALYQAKALGRNGFQFYDRAMSVAVSERLFLERGLHDALELGDLRVRYQPVVALPGGAVIGFEALAAWRHPQRGEIPPSTFIPVAEQCGLIERLGEAVLCQVAAQLGDWRAQGLPLLPVAVNVSARQLERGLFPGVVEATLAAHGVEPSLLQFEITESLLVGHHERPLRMLESLRRMGARVTIDDFGTGYSSLSYLKHLPIDSVKVDRGFVRDMQQDTRDAAIVSAIVGITHSLGLTVVAEGVETAYQATRLAELGCDAAQGFHFHGPLAPPQCRDLLRSVGSQRQGGDTLTARLRRWSQGAGKGGRAP